MEAIRICAVCGRVISEDDGWNIVNEGTDKEYIECDSCHDAEWESNKISVCAGCGGWFTVDMLHSEEPVPGHTFCPCPSCGKDFVEGMTRDEFLEEVEDTYIPKYSVVVIYGMGLHADLWSMQTAESRLWKSCVKRWICPLLPLFTLQRFCWMRM